MSNTVQVREMAAKAKTNGDGHGVELHDEPVVQHPQPVKVPEHIPTPAKPVAPREPRQRPWVWALISVAAVAATAAGIGYYIYNLSFESTDDAFIEGHIVPVSSRVSGHVAKVYIEDNQLVKEGDLLAELDPSDFETRLAAAEAALQVARATCEARATAVMAAETDVAQGKADWLPPKHKQRARTATETNRVTCTSTCGLPKSLDEATEGAHVIQADITAVRERIHARQLAIEQAKSAAKAAEGGVRQAEAELRQARLNCSYTKIYTPMSGHVTRKSIEVGAFVQVGEPILALVDPDVWVIANFKETQLAQMRPGQPVVITVDKHSNVKLPAHVDSIQYGSGARFSLLPPENATGNYVKVVQRVPVKITFDDLKQIDEYGLGPGMSVVPIVSINEPGRAATTATRALTSR